MGKDKLTQGIDCEKEVDELVGMGLTAVPDLLLIVALGNRKAKPEKASCPNALRKLLDAKGNPNCMDPRQQPGQAILHSACYFGTAEDVRLLLEFRADMEAKESRFQTPPLNTAIAAGNAKVC